MIRRSPRVLLSKILWENVKPANFFLFSFYSNKTSLGWSNRRQQLVACVSVHSKTRYCRKPQVHVVHSIVLLSNQTINIVLLVTGGPYAAFGGRDASRGLATFSVTASEKEWDDLSDLSQPEMDSVREWEMQFKGEISLFFATADTVFDVSPFVVYRKVRFGWTIVEGKNKKTFP